MAELDEVPQRVTIYEVGPRDGLQNEDGIVPVEAKAEFIRRLLAAGLPVVEATSFVHPKWVPQLADAGDLMTRLIDGDLGEQGRELPVLVPNERGLDRALELGCRHIAIFGSATETFAQRNLNRSLDEQFAMFEPTVTRARDAGLDVRAYVSMCFGDPWEGAVPIDQVVTVGRRLFDLGASQLSLGDTIGVGTAGHVRALLTAFNDAGLPNDGLAVHFHDTYGQALVPTRPPPSSTASPPSTRVPGVSAAVRTPRAQPATWPPRTSSGCCTASASRPASTWTLWSPRAGGWPAFSTSESLPRGHGPARHNDAMSTPVECSTRDRA